MKWFKRIVIAVPVIIVVILVTVFLINQITPKPISLLVRKQFDTSEKEQVYARPDDFQQKIEQIDIKKEIYKRNKKHFRKRKRCENQASRKGHVRSVGIISVRWACWKGT